MWHKNLYFSLYICFLVFWVPNTFSKEERRAREEMQPFKADNIIAGEDIQKILNVFDKYIDVASPLAESELRSMRYYKFSVKEEEKYIIIRVSHDNMLIMQELNKRIKGGGGEFVINSLTNEIVSFTLSK